MHRNEARHEDQESPAKSDEGEMKCRSSAGRRVIPRAKRQVFHHSPARAQALEDAGYGHP